MLKEELNLIISLQERIARDPNASLSPFESAFISRILAEQQLFRLSADPIAERHRELSRLMENNEDIPF